MTSGVPSQNRADSLQDKFHLLQAAREGGSKELVNRSYSSRQALPGLPAGGFAGRGRARLRARKVAASQLGGGVFPGLR
jgi:hypothetical protein